MLPVISIENADILGGERVVIYSLNMEIHPGDFAYITGKVGTGKTSVFRTLIAETRPQNGKCTVCGYDIDKIKKRDIPKLRRKIGVVFQDFQLLEDRSVRDNLKFVLEATGWKNGDEIDKRISEVLSWVGMTTKDHRHPKELSGGEQQKVAIARAILNNPEIILADEPTGSLDEESEKEIMDLLKKINAQGTAIIVITHNKALLKQYPGRLFECQKESVNEKV